MLIAHVNVAKDYRGGERQTELLMRELAALGIRQRLIARRGRMLARRIKENGFEVREVSGHLPGVVMATRGADLVHVHEGRSVYAAYLRHRMSRTPYVATRRVTNPIGDHYFAHRAYCAAARVVAIAPQVADVVRDFNPRVRLSVILSSSSGLESNPEQARAIRRGAGDGFIVGHIGALDNDQKAQDTIIAAARMLESSHPDIHFLLVGGGKDEAMLRELASGLSNLSFAGFVTNVGDFLAALDILVLPSRREGMGSILFDAMDHSLPIVATPVGGVPRIVFEDQNGYLIDVDEPVQLAERIVRLRSDPALRERLGATGRRMACGHTPPAMADAYLKVYESILE
jgi:glycosyltransferase involved in cell wall biosynthesis